MRRILVQSTWQKPDGFKLTGSWDLNRLRAMQAHWNVQEYVKWTERFEISYIKQLRCMLLTRCTCAHTPLCTDVCVVYKVCKLFAIRSPAKIAKHRNKIMQNGHDWKMHNWWKSETKLSPNALFLLASRSGVLSQRLFWAWSAVVGTCIWRSPVDFVIWHFVCIAQVVPPQKKGWEGGPRKWCGEEGCFFSICFDPPLPHPWFRNGKDTVWNHFIDFSVRTVMQHFFQTNEQPSIGPLKWCLGTYCCEGWSNHFQKGLWKVCSWKNVLKLHVTGFNKRS